MKTAVQNIIPYAFGEHHGRDDSWCAFKTDSSKYTHKDLPHGKPVHEKQLRKHSDVNFSADITVWRT